MKNFSLLFVLLLLISCNTKNQNYRKQIDLSGPWQFALDTANIGIEQKWYLSDLNDSIKLPGTTDLRQKGFRNKDTTTMHLNRVYKYEGVAWYRKKVVIPENFRDQHIQLFLERTKPATVWVDSLQVGSSKILQSPQRYDVTDYLTPGEHFITIHINNDLDLTPYGMVHIYTDETQTNWNGIIGDMYVEAMPKTYISGLQVYPDIQNRKIDIELSVENQLNLKELDVEILVEKTLDGKTTSLPSKEFEITYEPEIQLEYALDKHMSLWDEYQQPIYHVTAIISNGEIKDSKTVPFGMRKFAVDGTQFSINGRTTFLRGKNDAATFPLTSHTPMDVESWTRIFEIAKSYGINHYRYHSYCPPEAAFVAADRTGIYLQPELPFWGGLDSDSVADMLREEGFALLKAYANHPSFVMFSHGNEIWSGHDRVEENITALREFDDRPLYTMGSNNGIGYIPPRDYVEFFIGARTPYAHDSILTHTRLTHAFADSRGGGILNTQQPSTEVDFDYPVSQMDIPIISHEIGQYQIYPDYNEIDKYTGVVKAWNLEVFKERLMESGMYDQNEAFQKASGAWSALCYKAEMEAAIRTEGLAGFQLLDLQDFPGQGTALVGILDAFMDSKEVVSREEWLQSCNDVVLLLEFPKYCWMHDEQFTADVRVANYSDQIIDKPLHWQIKRADDSIIQSGVFQKEAMNNGRISDIGKIAFNLAAFNNVEQLKVEISIPESNYSNSYPVWVYPSTDQVEIPDQIMVKEELDKEARTKLQNGGKVLLFPQPEDVKENSVAGHFPPEFWNYGMFKGISESADKPVSPGTLGLLMDPEHPVFNAFPTDFHTNWQWFSIIKASNSLILDSTGTEYRPIVQVIDNLERNHKLGLVFEGKVGAGKLMVCMSRLNQLTDDAAAVQFYRSILNYMKSSKFEPDYVFSQDELNKLF